MSIKQKTEENVLPPGLFFTSVWFFSWLCAHMVLFSQQWPFLTILSLPCAHPLLIYHKVGRQTSSNALPIKKQKLVKTDIGARRVKYTLKAGHPWLWVCDLYKHRHTWICPLRNLPSSSPSLATYWMYNPREGTWPLSLGYFICKMQLMVE